ncbi:DNA-binding transcriptional regulator, LysR family [Saccharopolyspora antimicrobica]|uniref:DNA-binding transcriptional LysR family regulator n=1 Tax=Saccharopolyspora antimicrobica TaxID=455193 RepID=A0A1I5E8D3_9PSEU|nr:LysR family transcriptional regulator [Saccharopolyspora antimicrobica]RKT86707.1 DNA-binding transcriptional LysR family regulator [Saccharopolyspora antimicrobica]SFO07613.1 DNA-binding transcriptional regulator, LysR family [Saccharopolyspora antimicrobica]
MEFRELESFLVLTEELHFGRTAERLHVSPPRITQNLQSLEQRIGGRLFDRTSRRVGLTPLGEQFRDDISDAYAQLARALERATATARGISGTLRVGFIGSGANERTSELVTEFGARHPGCEVRMVEVHCADPLGPLRAGEVDVLIMRLPVDEPDLEVGPVLLAEPRMLAVPSGHPFAERSSVSVEDLARVEVVDVVGPAPDYWWEFHVPTVTPRGRLINRRHGVRTFQELLTAVANGQGVSPVVESVSRYYARPDIVLVPLRDMPDSEVALVWRTAGETARVRAFADTAGAVAPRPQTCAV